MYEKRILNSSRVRKIQGSFSWIDHRFITGRFLRDLSAVEILLYFSWWPFPTETGSASIMMTKYAV